MTAHPGIAWWSSRRPDRKIAGYGVADREKSVPVAPNTVFKIGSVSKQFIATGIMLLAQDGQAEGRRPGRASSCPTRPRRGTASRCGTCCRTPAGVMREGPAFDPSPSSRDIAVVRSGYSEAAAVEARREVRLLATSATSRCRDHQRASRASRGASISPRGCSRPSGMTRHPARRRSNRCRTRPRATPATTGWRRRPTGRRSARAARSSRRWKTSRAGKRCSSPTRSSRPRRAHDVDGGPAERRRHVRLRLRLVGRHDGRPIRRPSRRLAARFPRLLPALRGRASRGDRPRQRRRRRHGGRGPRRRDSQCSSPRRALDQDAR